MPEFFSKMEHEIKARVSKFVKDAEEAFPTLDVKHNGSLDKSEIDAAVMNSLVTGHAAETAAMLYKESEDIRKITGKNIDHSRHYQGT